MKLKAWALGALLVLVGSISQAQGIGVGAIIGLPSGFSFKGYLSENRAMDAALAWSTSGRDRLYAHGDYLIEEPDFFRVQEVALTLYYGIGLTIISREVKKDETKKEFVAGPRVPVGIRYEFDEHPIELFGELALQTEVIPDSSVGLGVGLGARYFF